MNKKKSSVLIALAVGDSLGMQHETKNWNHPSIMNWDGKYGSSDFHKLKPGAYTDDTHMSIAIAESLLENKSFNPQATATKYVEWYTGPNFVGAGKTTRRALEALKNGVPWYASGELDALGNGTAMRASLFGVYFKDEPTKLMKAAIFDAQITHNSYEAAQGSIAMATGVALLLNGVKKEEILDSVKRVLGPGRVLDNLNVIGTNKLIYDTIKNKDYDAALDRKGGNRIMAQVILGTKYTVIETVARAFYVFIATRSFKECIELAILGGHDTDTCASMAGALCGAYYGRDGIDQYYIDGLDNKDYILELDERLAG